MTYSYPMHILREAGTNLRHFDQIDEMKLGREQMVQLLCGLFNKRPENFPDILSDWPAFMSCVADFAQTEKKVWCPVAKTKKGVIDVDKLKKAYPKY